MESRQNAGTTIQVLFPTDPQQVACPVTPGDDGIVPEEPTRDAVKVLVVDDEEMIRTVSIALLEELGYETLAAASGKEALTIFRHNGDSINIVLLDQVMPDMDGVTVFKELRSIRPDIKVLLASGFSQQEVTERFNGLGLNGFIPKPYTLQSLSAELSRVLKETES